MKITNYDKKPKSTHSLSTLAAGMALQYVKEHAPSVLAAAGKRTYDAMMTPPQERGRSTGRQHSRDFKTKKSVSRSSQTRKGGFSSLRAGGIGKFGGKFRGMKRAKPKSQYRNGVTLQFEDGGYRSDGEAVYVGICSSPIDAVLKQVACCIIKELFRINGIPISNWMELVGNDYGAYLTYFNSSTSTATTTAVTISILGAASFAAAADSLVTTIRGCMNIYQTTTFDSITLAGATGTPDAKIKLDAFMLSFDHKAVMSVQNSTLGGTSAVPDGEDTAVTNNPVKCKVYECKGSGFNLQGRKGFGASIAPLNSNVARGYIMTTYASLSSATLDQRFQKPPPSSIFTNCTQKAKFNIAPGEIKTFSVSFKKATSFQNLIDKLWVFLETTQPSAKIPFGKTVMVGAEKMINTRTGENPVYLAVENNLRLSCSYKYKTKTLVMPINDVSTTGI